MGAGRAQGAIEVADGLFVAAEDEQAVAHQRHVASVGAGVLVNNGVGRRGGHKLQGGRRVAFQESDDAQLARRTRGSSRLAKLCRKLPRFFPDAAGEFRIDFESAEPLASRTTAGEVRMGGGPVGDPGEPPSFFEFRAALRKRRIRGRKRPETEATGLVWSMGENAVDS